MSSPPLLNHLVARSSCLARSLPRSLCSWLACLLQRGASSRPIWIQIRHRVHIAQDHSTIRALLMRVEPVANIQLRPSPRHFPCCVWHWTPLFHLPAFSQVPLTHLNIRFQFLAHFATTSRAVSGWVIRTSHLAGACSRSLRNSSVSPSSESSCRASRHS